MISLSDVIFCDFLCVTVAALWSAGGSLRPQSKQYISPRSSCSYLKDKFVVKTNSNFLTLLATGLLKKLDSNRGKSCFCLGLFSVVD